MKSDCRQRPLRFCSVQACGCSRIPSISRRRADARVFSRRLRRRAARLRSSSTMPDMVARGRGGMLSVTSVSGHGPVPFIAAYGSTKGHLVSLGLSLGPEVSGAGVTISVLSPGPVETGLLASMFSRGGQLSWLCPRLTPDTVARIGCDGFVSGRRVIVPGPRSRHGDLAGCEPTCRRRPSLRCVRAPTARWISSAGQR